MVDDLRNTHLVKLVNTTDSKSVSFRKYRFESDSEYLRYPYHPTAYWRDAKASTRCTSKKEFKYVLVDVFLQLFESIRNTKSEPSFESLKNRTNHAFEKQNPKYTWLRPETRPSVSETPRAVGSNPNHPSRGLEWNSTKPRDRARTA